MNKPEVQNIILNRVPWNEQNPRICEPFETLFRWVNRDRIEGFSYEAPLKDNTKAIDCIIGTKAIQLKNTKVVNKDKELAYMREVLKQEGREDLTPVLIQCTGTLYSKLLSRCDFNTPSVNLKPYQKEFIDKHLDEICSHHISIVNCFCRFGKSYLMRYIADMFRWEVSIITTKPTETAGDYAFDSVVSIQYLKLHPDTQLHDILFIDEAQESFMTELTTDTLDLDKFKHAVFFTGTSMVLEQYLQCEYYLAHYNFGDYIQNTARGAQGSLEPPVPGFPKIHFHVGVSPEPERGIRLVFDRNLTREKGREEAAAKGWKFQSAADDTDIKVSEEGTYLLISQFTTGATIPNCFVVEDRNESFTEQDIQLIFRCFNTTEVDTPRHVYFRNATVYKSVLAYLYRQTGKEFINDTIIKDFFSGIVNPADIDNCGFDKMRIHLDSSTSKALRRVINGVFNSVYGKIHERALNRFDNGIKNIIKSKRKMNQHEYRVLRELKKWLETGEVDPDMVILCMRLMTGLLLSAYQEKVDMGHINEFNQDIDIMYLWTHTKDKSRVRYQFETFRFSEDDFPGKGEFTEQICKGIFEVVQVKVKEKFLLNTLEMIQTPLSKQKYEEMCELYPTTAIEKKLNAEILTPWNIAEEMVNACEQCGVLYPGCKVLEPCCGKGVFLTLLLLRGYEVDYSDVSPANVQFCDILTGLHGSIQDALKRDDYAEYDLVITNPPYSRDRESNNQKETIYHLFGQTAFQAKASCLLCKAAFCTASGTTQKQLIKFRHSLIQHLQYKKFYKQDVFQGVQIQGGVMFYIYSNEYANPTPTEFITQEGIDIKTYDENVLTQFKWIPQIDVIQANEPRCIDSPQEGYIPCYMSNDRIKYFPRDQVPYDTNSWYVVFPEASFKGGDPRVFKRFITVKPGECFSKTFIGFKVKDEDEAEKLKAHLEKYEPEIAKLKKTHNIAKNYFRVVPPMPANGQARQGEATRQMPRMDMTKYVEE